MPREAITGVRNARLVDSAFAALIDAYPHLEQLIWVQEEPANMGAWGHLERAIGLRRPSRIRWDYVGRPRRASPSEGYAGSHQLEQERIIPIPRTSKRERLAENLGSLTFALSDAEMAEIGKLKRPDGRIVSPPQAPKWDS